MRNIIEEMKMADDPLYGHLFNDFKTTFRKYLADKEEYLPEFILTTEVRQFLSGIETTGVGECILDLFAAAAVETVKAKNQT